MEPVVVKVTSSNGTTLATQRLPPDRPANYVIDTMQRTYGLGFLASEVDGFGVLYSPDTVPSGHYTYSKVASEASADTLISMEPIGHLAEGINARLQSYCTTRKDTARKLLELVDEKCALLIRAPPGSGKTSLLQLIAKVNQTVGNSFERVYYISLAGLGRGEKTFDQLWEETYPGVEIGRLRSPDKCPQKVSTTRPTLLLVDEGQAAFNQSMALWDLLKSVMGGFKRHLRMIVVSAWGSAVITEEGHSCTTPGSFNADATVSLWPTEAITIALQLTTAEATELWDSWCHHALGDKLVSSDNIRDYVFNLTGRQPGLMVSVLDWLKQQSLGNEPANSIEEKARSLLLSSDFYDCLSGLRSLLKLRTAIRGKKPHAESIRSLLRTLLTADRVNRLWLNEGDRITADKVVKWGQVIEDNGWLSFPSKLHRQFLVRELYSRNDSTSENILGEGLLVFVRRVIERFDPHLLHSCVSRSAANNRVYESQYQNEFYRAACTIIPATANMSTEVGPIFRVKGYLDYMLSPYGWGFELLRDGDRLKEHTERFDPDGTYNKLLRDKVVLDYVILDFRMKPFSQPVKTSHAMHVVFSNEFKTATLHTFEREPELLNVGGTI